MHPDELAKQVLSSGKESVEVGRDADGEYLRAIRPTVASRNYLGKNCVACHQVAEGTVLGVVTVPLQAGVQIASDIAQGDLRHDVEVSSANEIGGLQLALREMVRSLRKVVGQFRID